MTQTPEVRRHDGQGKTSPSYGSLTVEKALDVLTVVASGPKEGVTNLEISQVLGLDKSTSHRLLMTLERRGCVRRREDRRRYGLGQYVNYLAARSYAHWISLLRPTLQQLVDATGESAAFSLRFEESFMCLDSVPSPKELRYCPDTGVNYPLNAGATGKVILAFLEPEELDHLLRTLPLDAITDRTITNAAALEADLETIRQNGYATSTGERVVGGCAVAAPVFDAAGFAFGAVSVSAVEARCPVDRLIQFKEHLLSVASQLNENP